VKSNQTTFVNRSLSQERFVDNGVDDSCHMVSCNCFWESLASQSRKHCWL